MPRLGAAITHLVRVLLKIPILRYVDDFFGPARLQCRRTITVHLHDARMKGSMCCSVSTLDKSLDQMARLIRLLLGRDAVAEDKLECGESLVVLGLQIDLSIRGFSCRPSDEKASMSIRASLVHHHAFTPCDLYLGKTVVYCITTGDRVEKTQARRCQQDGRTSVVGRFQHVPQVRCISTCA